MNRADEHSQAGLKQHFGNIHQKQTFEQENVRNHINVKPNIQSPLPETRLLAMAN